MCILPRVIESIPPADILVDSESGPLPEAVVGSCKVAIICGKAYSTPILSQIADEILSDVGLQLASKTGWGMLSRFPVDWEIKDIRGVTTHGAWRGRWDTLGWKGSITLGALDGERPNEIMFSLVAHWITRVFHRYGLRTYQINLAKAPDQYRNKSYLCNIRVSNGALLENDLWEQSQELLEESLSVARASGIEFLAQKCKIY